MASYDGTMICKYTCTIMFVLRWDTAKNQCGSMKSTALTHCVRNCQDVTNRYIVTYVAFLKLSNLFSCYSTTCSKHILSPGSVVIGVVKSLISFTPQPHHWSLPLTSRTYVVFHGVSRSSEPITFRPKSIKVRLLPYQRTSCTFLSSFSSISFAAPLLFGVLSNTKTTMFVRPSISSKVALHCWIPVELSLKCTPSTFPSYCGAPDEHCKTFHWVRFYLSVVCRNLANFPLKSFM